MASPSPGEKGAGWSRRTVRASIPCLLATECAVEREHVLCTMLHSPAQCRCNAPLSQMRKAHVLHRHTRHCAFKVGTKTFHRTAWSKSTKHSYCIFKKLATCIAMVRWRSTHISCSGVHGSTLSFCQDVLACSPLMCLRCSTTQCDATTTPLSTAGNTNCNAGWNAVRNVSGMSSCQLSFLQAEARLATRCLYWRPRQACHYFQLLGKKVAALQKKITCTMHNEPAPSHEWKNWKELVHRTTHADHKPIHFSFLTWKH